MKDVLILSIPLAGILVATYLMLQHFHNKSIHENDKEIDIQKIKTFFSILITAFKTIDKVFIISQIKINNHLFRLFHLKSYLQLHSNQNH